MSIHMPVHCDLSKCRLAFTHESRPSHRHVYAYVYTHAYAAACKCVCTDAHVCMLVCTHVCKARSFLKKKYFREPVLLDDVPLVITVTIEDGTFADLGFKLQVIILPAVSSWPSSIMPIGPYYSSATVLLDPLACAPIRRVLDCCCHDFQAR